MTGYYSFGHELGHNMGLNHARERPGGHGGLLRTRTATSGPGLPDGDGLRCPGTRILYFSNPNVSYRGKPTGVSEASPSSANNALSLNNTRDTVANWRRATRPASG